MTSAHKPKFEVTAEFIRNKVRSGEWQPGDKLPSQMRWAQGDPGHQVLYGTLRSAYLVLRAEGWIEGRRGEGVFVSKYPPIEQTKDRTKRS